MSLINLIKKIFLTGCPSCHDGFLRTHQELINQESKCEREGLDAYRFWKEYNYEIYQVQ